MTYFIAKADDYVFYIILGVIVVIFALMIVMQSRRRKTAQAEYTGMLDTLRTGMRVKTVGGVIGRIREIREEAPGFKTVLLETGSDTNKSLVLYDLQAIYGIVDDEKVAQAKMQSIQQHENANNGIDHSQNAPKANETKGKGTSTNKGRK